MSHKTLPASEEEIQTFVEIPNRLIHAPRNQSLVARLVELTPFLPSDASLMQRLWHARNNMGEIPKCKMCSNLAKWTSRSSSHGKGHRYSLYCSNSCRALDPDVNDRRKKTCIERHGHDKSLSNKDHLAKTRKTSLENNGVMFPLQNEAIRKETARSLQDHYGDNALETIRAIGREKLKHKYGDVSFGQMFSGSEFKDRGAATKKVNWLSTRLSYFESIGVTLLSDPTEHQNINTVLDWECTKCNTQFKSQIRDGRTPRCPTCFPLNRVNWQQQELVEFVRTLEPSALDNVRSVIPPKELDVYVPEKRVAIEFNGLYWHSDYHNNLDPHQYHLNKTERCEELGLRLIHVFHDEWVNKRAIVESIITRALGCDPQRVLYGRKCTIRAIDAVTCNTFLNENHIQGEDRSSVRYGLFHNDELVGVMTFGSSRFDKQYQWECHRLAFKIGTAVVGGSARLFNRFIVDRDPESIVSYSDRRFFTGAVYSELGFQFHSNTKPAYYYIHSKEACAVRHSRYKFQKYKLPSILECYDPSQSESANMVSNGYGRIWDCGNKKWVWKKKKVA